MTDITQTEGWRKAVEAIFDGLTTHNPEFDPPSWTAEETLRATLPHILAALAESAGPLIESIAASVIEEIKAFPPLITTETSERLLGPRIRNGLSDALAPLLARIQALEAERDSVRETASKLFKEHIPTLNQLRAAERQRDAAIEALRDVQWCARDGFGNSRCSDCYAFPNEGHSSSCPIGRVLHPAQPAPETTND